MTINREVEKAIRVAAVVEHNVSASELIETALRQFLALPFEARSEILSGAGRRRKGSDEENRLPLTTSADATATAA